MPLIGLLVDWTQLRKKSLSLRIYQQKTPKLKNKEKKRLKKKKKNKTEQNIQGRGTIKGVTYR